MDYTTSIHLLLVAMHLLLVAMHLLLVEMHLLLVASLRLGLHHDNGGLLRLLLLIHELCLHLDTYFGVFWSG